MFLTQIFSLMSQTCEFSSFKNNLLYVHGSSSDWVTFYPDSSYSHYVDTGSNQVSYSGNTFVENAIFWNFRTDGCIYITTSCNVLILYCVFENSYTQNSRGGGSIYQTAGQNIQSHVCSYKSSESEDNGWGGHSFVETDQSVSMKNYVLDSTITLSSGCYNIVAQNYGNSFISTTNISRSYCTYNVAYGVDYIANMSVVEYSSFSNCTSGGTSIGVQIGNNGIVNSCIFIGNTANNGGCIIRFDTSLSTCKNSIVQYNTAYSIFSTVPNITNCNLSPNSCTYNNLSPNDNKRLSLLLHLFSTMNCQAENPISPKQTVNTSRETRKKYINYSIFLGFYCY